MLTGMAWYADLGPIDYFPVEDSTCLRAVGWLEPEHPFPTGETSRDDFRRICELLVAPWQPLVGGGSHPCRLCQHSGGPTSLQLDGMQVVMGLANVFVPAVDVVFVAPSLIAHYIDAHRYAPPAELLAAVRVCPPMSSMEYQKALLAAGGRGLLRPPPDPARG